MRCPRCGRLNSAGAWDCEYCGADLEGASAQPPTRTSTVASRSSGLALTLILAGALALAGVGAVQASGLLQHALRTASAGDLAAQVCTDLTTQNYHALTSQIDPSSDLPSTPSDLDPATAAAAFQTRDSSAGKVSTCQYQQVSFVSSSSHGAVANYALTIRRGQQQASQSLVLVLIQQPDGTWKIARSSNLLGS